MRKILLYGILLTLSPVVMGSQQCKDISQLTALRYWDNPLSPYQELSKHYKSPVKRQRTVQTTPVRPPKATLPRKGKSVPAKPSDGPKTVVSAKLAGNPKKSVKKAVAKPRKSSKAKPTKTIRQVLNDYASRNGYELLVRKNDNILLDKQSAMGEIQKLEDLSVASNGRIKSVFVNEKTNELRIK